MWGLVPKDSLLDVPNALMGLVYYVLIVSYKTLRLPQPLVLAASLLSILFSMYLGYVLYTILENLCLVCVCAYVINF